jgi:hypothetical protein
MPVVSELKNIRSLERGSSPQSPPPEALAVSSPPAHPGPVHRDRWLSHIRLTDRGLPGPMANLRLRILAITQGTVSIKP